MIEPEVVDLLESGAATILGTVDADGMPFAMHAMGIKVLDDGTLRVALNAEETQAVENLRTTGVVALGATDVPTLRSVQVKGRTVTVEPLTAEDRIRTDRYVAAFFRAVHETDGTPLELLRRLRPRDFVALVMTVEELYDQTPGPQAGASLVGS